MIQRTSRNHDLICGVRLYVLTLLYASGLRIPVFDVVLNSSESPSLLAPKGSPTRQPSRLPTSVSRDNDNRQGFSTLC
jgi:hypothetical protein